MSVVIETTQGDITVDLYINDRPRACLNFLKLCKMKYYNFNLFHTISRGFIAQTGDPSGSRSGGESIYGVLDGQQKRFFEGENEPRIKHTKMGLISFVGSEERMLGSQFFLTLGDDLTYLDEMHCVFGEVVEGFDVLEIINEAICDTDDRPYQDIRITHTVILDDPFPDPKRLRVPSRSPSPNAERLKGGRIAPDEDVDETEGKTPQELSELQAEREAKARAAILEMVGDLPDAEMAPPENILFVCKLNPVTTDDDLEIIFSRFGKIKSCEVIRDKKSGDSLQYAFVEFEDKNACENAYFKMDNVLIDDRRIHVDFSQSVSKVKWRGKGRGVTHYDEKGRASNEINKDIGKGNYKLKNNYNSSKRDNTASRRPRRSVSPSNNRTRNSFSSSKKYSEKSRPDADKFDKYERNKSYSTEKKHRYSKSPETGRDKYRPLEKDKYASRLNLDRSSSSKKLEYRRNESVDTSYRSNRNRKRSQSPNGRDIDLKRNSKRRSRSRSPRRNDKRNGHSQSEKYYAATSSRKARERSASKEANSDSDSKTNEKKTEKYNAKYKSHSRRPDYNRKNNDYSPERKHSNKRKSSTSDTDSEGESKSKKKKKGKYSSSDESDSDSDAKLKKKKSSSNNDQGTKKKSKKKKSSKKTNYESSSDSDSYKKKSKKKKKYDSDSS